MKISVMLFMLWFFTSCVSDISTLKYNVPIQGSVYVTPIKYEKHDYLIFSGVDYTRAVVHSASCNYCDSIKHINAR